MHIFFQQARQAKKKEKEKERKKQKKTLCLEIISEQLSVTLYRHKLCDRVQYCTVWTRFNIKHCVLDLLKPGLTNTYYFYSYYFYSILTISILYSTY